MCAHMRGLSPHEHLGWARRELAQVRLAKLAHEEGEGTGLGEGVARGEEALEEKEEEDDNRLETAVTGTGDITHGGESARMAAAQTASSARRCEILGESAR